MRITSARNPKVRAWAELKTRRGRLEQGRFLVEGAREAARARAAGIRPQAWLVWPERAGAEEAALLADAPVYELSEAAMRKVSYRENPPALIGVFERPARRLEDLPTRPRRVLVAVEIEKPGNLGAMLRSADASGADAVLVVGEAVDPENPNVIRASTGTVFTLPLAAVDHDAARAWLRERGLQIVAAAPRARRVYWEADLSGPTAFVVGAEDRGLPPGWLEAADLAVRIPMEGVADSLNASVSAALLLYEGLRRQRRG
ncbi:tRNA/rRNA methyltransferase (SpoU) [Oceanithermus profundus DSM 14977]|uniref:tRNA/rRNA methyltransferase (SpoU) n=1 Tax=Oceanithermus profundus (strain DSM 14977 / NBRC 100410 / VKM B-2274 / 506) TaxID=670487 RepID=E4U9N4_OCEP5|nr:TrmH family RNA methyltransferase [Oceanithermus profundus]ADR37198.1 tRNA/rRNA methyltransferase (SpoU) [Oceanithermus profundus DSM 14977]